MRLAALLLACGATLASATDTRPPLPLPDALAEALRTGPPDTIDELRLLQEQIRRVVELGRAVTVAVEMNDSVGSGVIVSPDGLVLTAGHVCVEPGRELMIRFADGHRVKGMSLGVNHPLDSGMARITADPATSQGPVSQGPLAKGPVANGPVDRGTAGKGPTDDEPTTNTTAGEGAAPAEWPFLPIAEEALHAGDWVIGLGQPNGYVDGRAPPVRLGRVLAAEGDTINTDATLVGGDSGGPLLNLQGEVVGIHSKIGEQVTSNYHVPVATYRREWERLVDGRMTGVPDGDDPDDWRPLVGLALRPTDDGLVVTQVFPDRAADKGGVAVGDVLVSLAGQPIDDAAQVDRLVRRQEAFSRVPLVVRRDNLTVELELWLGRAPADFPGSQPTEGVR